VKKFRKILLDRILCLLLITLLMCLASAVKSAEAWHQDRKWWDSK
jgi:hypothetical protein